VLGRNEKLLIYVPARGETLQGVAARFLGSADETWQLVQANPGVLPPVPGQPLVVPLAPRFMLGVRPEEVQAVPILCYHRIAHTPSKMAVTPGNFDAQLQWLADNGWRVVRLSDYAAFMAGRKALPPRSVVITFDDGYASVHRHAFGTLKKHGAPATLFLYTDFLGASDALSWAQLEEMWQSGLVDIQAHSKGHRRLTERAEGQTEAAYRQQLDVELKHPRTVLERRLAAAGLKVRHFAYPYGDANETVLEATRRAGYQLGLTVVPGANPFYASPLLLRRVMIYGDHSLEDFKARLTIPPQGR
jgi:peptidoglycan/xylan/chitin deacetylase (PgdA/CDA1 family)